MIYGVEYDDHFEDYPDPAGDAVGNTFDFEKNDGTVYEVEVTGYGADEDVYFFFDVRDYHEETDQWIKVDVDSKTEIDIHDFLLEKIF